jgi:hypothetical protein
MSTVTYSNPAVEKALTDFFVPVKLETRSDPKIAQFFKVNSTPTFVATDSNRKVHSQSKGFFPPEAFLQQIRFMRAIVELNHRDYDLAIDLLSQVTRETFDQNLTPEALYHLGVARYMKTSDFTQAVQEWRKIKLQFPHSSWLKKIEYAL